MHAQCVGFSTADFHRKAEIEQCEQSLRTYTELHLFCIINPC